MGYFPVFINMEGLNVLVLGGGKVGTKRALEFLEYGANVTVISLDFSEDLLSIKNDRLILIKKNALELSTHDLQNYDIIITATNNKDINNKICKMARDIKKLCNNPTNPEFTSFIVPIFYIDNYVGIAVTTFGKSSLISKMILDNIKSKILTREIYNNIDIMFEIKKLLKEKINNASKRFDLYHIIFYDKKFSELLSKGDSIGALKRAEEIINEYSKQ